MAVVQKSSSKWQCVNCGYVLGNLIASEYYPAEELPADHIHTQGPNLAVTCPKCGQVKVWYTSDAIVRAMHQLIDATVSVAATRFVHLMGPKIMEYVSETYQQKSAEIDRPVTKRIEGVEE